jgi:hypothetical protein
MTDWHAQQDYSSKERNLSLVSRLKGGGYLTSSISIALLAIPGLKAALTSPVMALCMLGGIMASIGGMYLRWRSHRLEQKEKD